MSESFGTDRERTAVVEEDAERRRRGVVELAAAHGPHERGEEAAGHQAARGDQQHDDAHAATALRPNQRMAPAARPMTVSELTGIRMAVASGVSRPVRASPRPSPL